jgi:diguanylate cyclase (GGDEF)-like protein
MIKVFIIGAGNGGKAVLRRLLRFNWVQIAGVADLNPSAPGILLAKEANLPVFFEDPLQKLSQMELDLVFELTGSQKMQDRLLNLPARTFDVVSGQASYLLWKVIEELEEQEIYLRSHLGEHRVLTEINSLLSNSETPEEIFEAIVMGGIRMTGMPAGSLSIYNRERKELYLAAAKGFSFEFYKDPIYPVRPRGLTEFILSRHEPIAIPDIADHPSFNNPILVREGVRSLIAVPLISDTGPVGILYVDAFKPQTFTASMIESLQLLATQAVIAIQKQQAFDQIKSLAIRDPLTGLYNRRYLNEIFRAEIDRATRLNRPFSLMLIDIDHFKGINDRFGHLFGDQVLRGLAQLYGANIRPYDTLTRFGGEEFLLLMPETDEREAQDLAERLRAATASASLLPEATPITCSFGLTSLRQEQALPPPEELVQRADSALYDAKRSGRNRVHTYQAGMTLLPENKSEPDQR